MSSFANVVTVARREYTVRARTRSFLIGTALLIVGVVVIAWLPVIVGQVDRSDATKIVVASPDAALAATTSTSLGALLNAPTGSATTSTSASDPAAAPDYVVTVAPDVATGRASVTAGTESALLAIERTAGGELSFTLYTNDPATGRVASLIRQAANTLVVADRLDRLGIRPADRATLFGPATFGVAWADPARTGPVLDASASVGQDLLAFGMTILIFMIIVMYGNWIAASVVEEKSSRVMEVVLNAATPFELLTGKVFGVGLAAFTQYGAVVVSGGLAIALERPIATLVLGSSAAALGLPEGLTPGLLFLFGVYGIAGFLLYATLYAAAGSLVSRQEDVQTAVMPMTLISTAGYMVGVYAATGLLDIKAGWLFVVTELPFLSPFMMLGRIAAGAATPGEVILSLVLLAVSIVVALWLAARIYAAGVLLYGQRPGLRAMWRLVREGM